LVETGENLEDAASRIPVPVSRKIMLENEEKQEGPEGQVLNNYSTVSASSKR
jgi:hypothetical protein